MYNFTLGFMTAMLIAMVVVSYSPTPKTDLVCKGCGSLDWWSVNSEDFVESEDENE